MLEQLLPFVLTSFAIELTPGPNMTERADIVKSPISLGHYRDRLLGWSGAVTFALGLGLSPHFIDTLKLLRLAGEGAIAEYRLRAIPAETYATEAAAALEANDADLARSIVALAGDRGVALPVELTDRVAALPAVDLLNIGAQGWNCIVNGDFETEGGFACVVAVDLTSVGDVRDLVVQGGNYLTGQPVDYFALGISSVGLTLTAATIGTGGGMLPVRVGASFLKAAKKAGKVSVRLAGDTATLLARTINRSSVDEALVLAREFRVAELGRPLGQLFDPKAVAAVSDLATDVGRIGAAGGVRAMKLSVEAADSARDIRVLARTADRFQDRFPAVMKLLGRGAIRLGDLVWTIGGWIVGSVLWVLGMGWFVLRATTATVRLSHRGLMRLRRVPGHIAVRA
jgi:hypothetical protein